MPEKLKYLHFESVDSTNDICMHECKKNRCPTVVTADSQKKGRGRNQKNGLALMGTSHIHLGS